MMSPLTPELASRIKGELGSPQIIVPAGALGTSVDWTAKLKVIHLSMFYPRGIGGGAQWGYPGD